MASAVYPDGGCTNPASFFLIANINRVEPPTREALSSRETETM